MLIELHSFPVTYPTANDYSRLQTFNQRLSLDKGRIFAAINKKHCYMEAQDDKTIQIPMEDGKEALKQRQEIISQVYRRWTEENPDKRVYNRSLKDYINIRYLSITETMRHASKKYSSTLALLQLDTILRYSVVYGKPKPPKKGIANQKIFSYMLEMRYELVGIGLVKMMVGVKRTGEKIQYCITAIEA